MLVANTSHNFPDPYRACDEHSLRFHLDFNACLGSIDHSLRKNELSLPLWPYSPARVNRVMSPDEILDFWEQRLRVEFKDLTIADLQIYSEWMYSTMETFSSLENTVEFPEKIKQIEGTLCACRESLSDRVLQLAGDEYCAYQFAQMIHLCDILRQLDVQNSPLTEEWTRLIKFHLSDVVSNLARLHDEGQAGMEGYFLLADRGIERVPIVFPQTSAVVSGFLVELPELLESHSETALCLLRHATSAELERMGLGASWDDLLKRTASNLDVQNRLVDLISNCENDIAWLDPFKQIKSLALEASILEIKDLSLTYFSKQGEQEKVIELVKSGGFYDWRIDFDSLLSWITSLHRDNGYSVSPEETRSNINLYFKSPRSAFPAGLPSLLDISRYEIYPGVKQSLDFIEKLSSYSKDANIEMFSSHDNRAANVRLVQKLSARTAIFKFCSFADNEYVSFERKEVFKVDIAKAYRIVEGLPLGIDYDLDQAIFQRAEYGNVGWEEGEKIGIERGRLVEMEKSLEEEFSDRCKIKISLRDLSDPDLLVFYRSAPGPDNDGDRSRSPVPSTPNLLTIK